ncbi:MAG: hypothetical protein M0008_13140, partial [Actinomycetota bacterium]|nr:hypothetical protein [Actinomycetota bacterium]
MFPGARSVVPCAPLDPASGSRIGGALRGGGRRGAMESAGLVLADEASQVWFHHVACDPRSCAHLKSPTPYGI